jgi:hypothetical protein
MTRPKPALLKAVPLAAWLLLGLLLGVTPRAALADDWGEARKAFLKGQRSEKWQDRVAAYAELSFYDTAESVGEALSALSKEDHAAVRLAAIKGLAAYASKPAVEALHKTIRSGKDPARLYVILALGEQPGPAGKDVLLEVLTGRDAAAAAQAALALGKKQVLEARPHLLDLLKHKEWRLRAAAARALRALAGASQPPEPGKPLPPAPAVLRAPDTLNALVDAIEIGEGRERADVIGALARLTGADFGWDVAAWRAIAGGAKPADVARAPRHTAYFFGVPVHGRRLVILVDCNKLTEDAHPFTELERLKEVLKVPGARPIPWAGVRTLRQFLHGHVKRCINDLPSGTLFDLVLVAGKARPVFGKFTSANDGTKAAAIAALEESALDTANDMYTALDAALDIASRKDSVAWDAGPEEILYADVAMPWLAENTDPLVIAPAIALKARLRMVPITAVGVGEHPYDLLSQLAESTGGTYVGLGK